MTELHDSLGSRTHYRQQPSCGPLRPVLQKKARRHITTTGGHLPALTYVTLCPVRLDALSTIAAASSAVFLQGAVADNLLDRLDDCVARFRTVAILGGAGFEVMISMHRTPLTHHHATLA